MLSSNRFINSKENNEMRDKAYNICREFLSGSWKNISSHDMVFQSIGKGLSNVLFYCSLPSTHTPLVGEPSQVLLRMYGQLHSNGADSNESKMTESLIFMLLSERKLGPKLYGIFPGGRLEEYIPARALSCRELKDPMLSSIIARKLAHVHGLDVPINREPCWLFDTMYQWLDNFRSNLDLKIFPKDQKLLGETFIEFDFESELKWLKSFLNRIKSPVVFSHNDLQEGNILLPNRSPLIHKSQNENGKIKDLNERIFLIDFEYCSYNYRGFDFGNHFCEWAFDYSNSNYPYFYSKPDKYPSESEKRHFIREYIKSSEKCRKSRSEINSEDHILKEANYYILASHMLWTLWSINSGYSSQILFGYWEYGKERLHAYLDYKQHFLKQLKQSK